MPKYVAYMKISSIFVPGTERNIVLMGDAMNKHVGLDANIDKNHEAWYFDNCKPFSANTHDSRLTQTFAAFSW